jgi:hypothetical protein
MPSHFINDPSNPNPVYLSDAEILSFKDRNAEEVQYELIQRGFLTRICKPPNGGRGGTWWGINIYANRQGIVTSISY